MAWGRRRDRSDPCSWLSWAGPKHDLRGMCVFVCVCVYCAGGLYVIYDLGGRLLHVVCVCEREPDRAEPAGAPRLGWRPSNGGRQSSVEAHLLWAGTGEPKVLQSASYLEYGPQSLRGRPQQPPVVLETTRPLDSPTYDVDSRWVVCVLRAPPQGGGRRLSTHSQTSILSSVLRISSLHAPPPKAPKAKARSLPPLVWDGGRAMEEGRAL